MGYTHYWTPSKTPIPAVAITVLTSILEHGQRAGIIEVKGDQALRISDKEIWFNGIEDDSCETFAYKVGGEWNFCKTNRRPYDVYVCATLLVLDYYISIDFYSDGGVCDGEWKEALNLLQDNDELFNLDQNLIDSIVRIREGEDGLRDLFEHFPLCPFEHKTQ